VFFSLFDHKHHNYFLMFEKNVMIIFLKNSENFRRFFLSVHIILTMTDNFAQFSAEKFYCKTCDYKCIKNSDWNRHILTRKHKNTDKMLTNVDTESAESAQEGLKDKILNCICGKEYKHRQSLFVHNINEELPTNENLVQYLLKENSDFKNLIMELVKKEYMSNSNNINNTTNNTTNNVNSNNSFNLNLFLNDTCKGAMNMSEFVNTIAIQMSDLENFAHMDYANGVSKILLKNLNNLETNQRPIHCTDLKRETVYIKENDCWIKETDEKQNLKKAIKQIAFKNIRHINEWVKENPGCQDPRTKQNVKYNKIVMNSMSGGTIEEQEDNIEKIVKNVTKAVTIDKYSLK